MSAGPDRSSLRPDREFLARNAVTACLALLWSVVAMGDGAAMEPTRLTALPGHATEAAWSPDGSMIAFQYDEAGRRDIRLLSLGDGGSRVLATPPGQACYPAWTRDGGAIICSVGRITTTAVQAAEDAIAEGYHLFRVPLSGGTPVQVTAGRVRDYCPAVSPDGSWVWFTSTKGLRHNSAGICRLSLTVAGAEPESVRGVDRDSTGAVQPDVSPDGRHVAYGHCSGIRDNWAIAALQVDDPRRSVILTPEDMAAYGPRWSPEGRLIACTGYRVGDPGWSVYLVEPPTGAVTRLDTGEGNARSPAWSPDGRSLVFESDRSGSYNLYRLSVPPVAFPAAVGAADRLPRRAILKLDLRRPPEEGRVADLSGMENAGVVDGSVPWGDAGPRFDAGSIRVPSPHGSDFGDGAFYARVTLRVEAHTDALRLAIVGDYPEHRLGWQIFVNDKNLVYFNARSRSGQFIGVASTAPLPTGREVVVTGMRDHSGTVELYVDGHLQGRQRGAGMVYGKAGQIRIGRQFDGGLPFAGTILAVEAGSGPAAEHRTRAEQLREFFQ